MKKPTKTGKDPMMGFRASPALRTSIIRWSETHPNVPPLSEAARLLVELGLAASSPSRPSGKMNNAARMASRQLDQLADKTSPHKNKRAESVGCLEVRRNFRVCASTSERQDRGAAVDREDCHARSEAHRKQDR